MKNSVKALTCALCVTLFLGTACKKATSQADNEAAPDKRYSLVASTEPPPPGEPPPENQTPPAAPPLDLANLSKFVGPAVLVVSVFDASGKLATTATGFFVAEDGKFVTTARAAEGGANAVAKTADGKIYNVTGVLGTSATLDLALLQADAKRVPFLPLNPIPPKPGTPLAILGSPLQQKTRPPLEVAVSEKPDANDDRLALGTPLLKDLRGSPVVDGNGEVVGVVTTVEGEGAPPVVVRTASARNQLLSSVPQDAAAKWAVVAEGTPPPPPPWEDEKTPTPKPSVAAVSKLIHTPPPIYPMGARFSRPPIKGSGRYRVVFSPTGEAKGVQVIQSTGSPLLDTAAVNALRQWRSAPGREWSTNVPVTFGR